MFSCSSPCPIRPIPSILRSPSSSLPSAVLVFFLPSQFLLSLLLLLATSSPSIPSLLVQLSFVIYHYALGTSGTGDHNVIPVSPTPCIVLSWTVPGGSVQVISTPPIITPFSSHVSTVALLPILSLIVARSPIPTTLVLLTGSGEARAQSLPLTPCFQPWISLDLIYLALSPPFTSHFPLVLGLPFSSRSTVHRCPSPSFPFLLHPLSLPTACFSIQINTVSVHPNSLFPHPHPFHPFSSDSPPDLLFSYSIPFPLLALKPGQVLGPLRSSPASLHWPMARHLPVLTFPIRVFNSLILTSLHPPVYPLKQLKLKRGVARARL